MAGAVKSLIGAVTSVLAPQGPQQQPAAPVAPVVSEEQKKRAAAGRKTASSALQTALTENSTLG